MAPSKSKLIRKKTGAKNGADLGSMFNQMRQQSVIQSPDGNKPGKKGKMKVKKNLADLIRKRVVMPNRLKQNKFLNSVGQAMKKNAYDKCDELEKQFAQQSASYQQKLRTIEPLMFIHGIFLMVVGFECFAMIFRQFASGYFPGTPVEKLWIHDDAGTVITYTGMDEPSITWRANFTANEVFWPVMAEVVMMLLAAYLERPAAELIQHLFSILLTYIYVFLGRSGLAGVGCLSFTQFFQFALGGRGVQALAGVSRIRLARYYLRDAFKIPLHIGFNMTTVLMQTVLFCRVSSSMYGLVRALQVTTGEWLGLFYKIWMGDAFTGGIYCPLILIPIWSFSMLLLIAFVLNDLMWLGKLFASGEQTGKKKKAQEKALEFIKNSKNISLEARRHFMRKTATSKWDLLRKVTTDALKNEPALICKIEAYNKFQQQLLLKRIANQLKAQKEAGRL